MHDPTMLRLAENLISVAVDPPHSAWLRSMEPLPESNHGRVTVMHPYSELLRICSCAQVLCLCNACDSRKSSVGGCMGSHECWSLKNPLQIMPLCCAAGMLSYWPSFGPLSQLGSPLDRTRSSSLSGSSQPSRQPSMLPVSPTQAQLNSIVMGASKLPAGASPASTPGQKALHCMCLCNASEYIIPHLGLLI